MKLDALVAKIVSWTSSRLELDEEGDKHSEREAALTRERDLIIKESETGDGASIAMCDFEAAVQTLKPILIQLKTAAAPLASLPPPPTSLNPKDPIFEKGWVDNTINAIFVLSVFAVLGTISLVWWVVGTKPDTGKGIVAFVAGLYATVPPLYFFCEYFFLYRKAGKPGSLDLYKQGQQVAFAIWAGITTALVALSLSDFVKPNTKYSCEIVANSLDENSSNTFQLSCDKKSKSDT